MAEHTFQRLARIEASQMRLAGSMRRRQKSTRFERGILSFSLREWNTCPNRRGSALRTNAKTTMQSAMERTDSVLFDAKRSGPDCGHWASEALAF